MNVSAGASVGGMLTAEDVQEILHLLDAAHLDELHLETERFTLTLRRAAGGGWTQQTQVTAVPNIVPNAVPNDVTSAAASGAAAEARAAAAPPAAPSPPAAEGPTSSGTPDVAEMADVRAPLPGTFYRAPNPGAAPFVEVGSRVQADTVVGIVETMKLMNSVFAGVAGTVAEICLADATMTAQDGVLLRIRPAAAE